jgi:hypothetical protein
MRISRESLERESAATGFRAEILEKVIHLFSLLDGFKKHPFLKGKWALKGGTALNLFWFDVPRLSELSISTTSAKSSARPCSPSARRSRRPSRQSSEGSNVITSRSREVIFLKAVSSVCSNGVPRYVDRAFI